MSLTGQELRETVQIVNIKGLHARASAKFVNTVAMLPEGLDVKVIKDGIEAGGGSILGLMMLGAGQGRHGRHHGYRGYCGRSGAGACQAGRPDRRWFRRRLIGSR